MKDLEGVQFSMLYMVVKELAQKQLEEKQILLVRNLAQFARVNNAFPTLDTAIYSIIYSTEINDFIVSQIGSFFSPHVIYFNNKEVAYRALNLYKKQMEDIVYLTEVVGELSTNLTMVEDNSPFTRSELIDLYYKLSEGDVE